MRRQIAVLSLIVGILAFSSAGFAAPPVLEVSPTYLEFSAYVGAPNPSNQIISIWRGGGNGPLNWEVTEDCNWIVVEPNSGKSMGEVDDVNVIVDISGLSAGTYNCELTVDAGTAVNSPQIVDVNLVVYQPIIELSATQFEFYAFEGGANPNDQIFSISNIGTGILNWEIAEYCGWLSAEPNSGSSTGEVDDVNLSVDIAGLGWGTYNCNLMISDPNAANSPRMVEVTLYLRNDDGKLHVPLEYPTIQMAIDDANDGEEVIVAPGTYTSTGNKNLDFGGKAITVRSIDPEDPCVVATTIIDCENSGRGFYFHSGEGLDSIVSGFTIKNGYIVGTVSDRDGRGGGVYCSGASPTIENCIIINSQAKGRDGTYSADDWEGGDAYGGAIFCTSNSNPTIINCTMSSNKAAGGRGGANVEASPGGKGYGGAVCCTLGSSPAIINCAFSNNNVSGGRGYGSDLEFYGTKGGDAGGGAIWSDSTSNPTIENCDIIGNTASGGIGGDGSHLPASPGGHAHGGGIYLGAGGAPTITNCALINNQATGGAAGFEDEGGPGTSGNGYGGGLYCGCDGEATVENCTVYGNTAARGTVGLPGYGYGGGVYCCSSPTVTNGILWGNSDSGGMDESAQIHGGTPVANYSCIQGLTGGLGGTGNIGADPCFVTGPSGNYYLSQIAAGQATDSPCVDAGSDTASNLGLEIYTTRTDEVGDAWVVDMGYHYPMPNPADINGDGYIDFVDFAILASQWRQAPGVPSADIAPPGGDGIVDIWDLELLMKYWLW